jgi:hypothetical protein
MQRLTVSLACLFAFLLSAAAQVPSRNPESLVVDVLGNGYRFTSPENGVMFDLDGTGTPQRVAWTEAGSDDAFLAIDHNHNGRIDGGRELLGGGTSGPPGFSELNAYEGFLTPADLKRATNRQSDGVLTAADAVFSQLLLWTDTNHNGESEESELVSVARAGFTTIYLGYSDKWSKYDGFGNLLHYQGQALQLNAAGVQVLRNITSVRFLR